MKKIKIAVLFGGQSTEHQVSIMSAKNVVEMIDEKKYEVFLLGISQSGKLRWLTKNDLNIIEKLNDKVGQEIYFRLGGRGQFFTVKNKNLAKQIDVVWPVLHGARGEDGTIQGYLKLAGVPFVGAEVLGSAIGMDKEIMKRLLEQEKIKTAKWLSFRHRENIDVDLVEKYLGWPVFVKPSNSGSSIGVAKVTRPQQLKKACNMAFGYDNKILVEEEIKGREIECAIMGNEKKLASLPGEILVHDDFYSYSAKYEKEKGANLSIPARLSKEKIKKIKKLAIRTCQILEIEGMARVDFFLKNNGEILINEINTLPGFTKNSMYPILWEVSGIKKKELVDQLIGLAKKRMEREKISHDRL